MYIWSSLRRIQTVTKKPSRHKDASDSRAYVFWKSQKSGSLSRISSFWGQNRCECSRSRSSLVPRIICMRSESFYFHTIWLKNYWCGKPSVLDAIDFLPDMPVYIDDESKNCRNACKKWIFFLRDRHLILKRSITDRYFV